jgi:hypothetical protein
MGVVLVLVFVGLPIGVLLLIAGFVWPGAVLVLIAFVLAFVLPDEIHAAVSDSGGAAVGVVRRELHRHRLARRLDRLTRELGEAVFSGNQALAEVVNHEAHETAAELQAVADGRRRE